MEPAISAPPGPAVAAAFDLGTPIAPASPAARGELGRIWRLETDRGRWAVKELFEPMTEVSARADVGFQRAAHTAGVPLPEPIVGAAGRVLAELPRGPDGDGITVRIYRWVDLAAPPVTPPAETAAAILGQIHGLAYPADGPPDPWFSEPIEVDRWAALLRRAQVAGVTWAADLDLLVANQVAAQFLLERTDLVPLQRCHLDYNPENVLTDAAGRPIVIDWENSGSGSAEQELASALYEFVADPRDAAAFLAAYRDGGGSAAIRGAASFALAVAVQGHLVDLYARRALDPGGSEENRSRSERWITEIARRPLTLELVERYLA